MDVAHTEAADAELVRMIERRSRKGEVDPDEVQPFYMERAPVQRPQARGEPPRLVRLLRAPCGLPEGEGR